ncbi:MAG: DUF4349 domain-containing protein [Oscillospiraceae bacterium]|jgi:hypothetical protein|nr:DUF4349 domain-containing protein [Oscillospiraceae bacterium]
MKRVILTALVLLTVIGVTACSAQLATSPQEPSYPSAYDNRAENGGYDGKGVSGESFVVPEYASSDVLYAPEYSSEYSPEYAPQPTTGDVTVGRKRIKTASITLETLKFDESVVALESLCLQYGGYIESSNVYGSNLRDYDSFGNYWGNSRYANYRMRIPEPNYLAFMNNAGSVGVRTSKSESEIDVSDAYYDTESRLEILRLQRDRFMKLLETATDAESIIAFERSLSDTIYEIERMTGTLRRYDNDVNYATFDIQLSEVIEYTPSPTLPPKTFGQKIAAAFEDAVQGLIDGFQAFVIWLAGGVFGLIILAVILVVAWLVIRRHIRKRKTGISASSTTASDESAK